jgi:PAS domain S-box-containing protein
LDAGGAEDRRSQVTTPSPDGELTTEVGKEPGPGVPVLIVDDNASKRLALKAVLEPLGYLVVEADSGLAALRHVMTEEFAVILLDVRMPKMDGFETAARLRQRVQTEFTPIIFITAFGSEELVDFDRYAEGAVDFLFAPVDPSVLRGKVSAFGNLFKRSAQLASHARASETSVAQLRLLTDAAPIGIYQTDTDNRYIYTNPRWSAITGIEPDAASGREWATIIDPDQRSDLMAELDASAQHRVEFSRRFKIRGPGSMPRVVLVTSVPVPATAGGTAGWVGTVADVTAEVGAEEAMSRARDEANAASQLKSDFLTNMSHEIRTPMNGVIGMTDLLLETGLDARQHDYAQTVRDSGEALLAILNDILDFAMIEAGKLAIEQVEFTPRHVVEDVMDLLASGARSKGLELVGFSDESVPITASGDPGRLRQVLTNLIGNAIKFTSKGEVVVRVMAEASGEDVVLRFDVSDTGEGIASEKRAVIFEPFVQADSSTSRRYGGTGLGLAISSELVTLMGGECGVRSELGTGSTFWFTIRVRAHSERPASGQLSLGTGLFGRTALVADDNATQCNVLADHLTQWGMSVMTAPSAESALSRLQTAEAEGTPFDVALLDHSMSGMDERVLSSSLSGSTACSTPLILMTDLGQQPRPHGGSNHPAGAWLSKPIREEDLLTSLRVALVLQVVAVTRNEPVEETSWVADPLMGRVLLAEDNLINQKVAVAMLSSVGYRVDTVLDGAAAVAAVAAQPYDAVLMDCQMPVLSGYEAATAIRAQEGSDRRTPIIAMTAAARHGDLERCLAAGMDCYLAKPVSKSALLDVVAGTMKTCPPTHATPSEDPDAAVSEVTLDQAVIEDLRALDDPLAEAFLTDLVNEFLDETPPLLLQLRDALEAGDSIAVGRVAHRINGSCGQLGGRRLASSCSRLEEAAAGGRLGEGHSQLEHVERDFFDLRRRLSRQFCSPLLPRRFESFSDPIAAASETEVAPPSDAGTPPPPADVTALDPELLARLERLGQEAGQDLVLRLAQAFLADAATHVITMEAALAGGEPAAVMWAAHTLCGSSGNVGATDLSRLCAALAIDGGAADLSGSKKLLDEIQVELGRVRTTLASRGVTS